MVKAMRTILLIAGIGVIGALLVSIVVLGRERILAMVFGPVDLSPIDFRTLHGRSDQTSIWSVRRIFVRQQPML